MEALAPSLERERLEGEFALVREAMDSVRVGKQLGFGALADPEPWLARLGPESARGSSGHSVLTPMELLDVARCLETAAWLRDYFRDSRIRVPGTSRRERNSAWRFSRGCQRRFAATMLPDGAISDDASPELRRIRANDCAHARQHPENFAGDFASRAARSGRGLRDAAQRSIRDSGPRGGPAPVSVRDAIMHGASATGQTVFVEPLVADGDEQSTRPTG